MPTKHNNVFLQALFQATDYGILMTDVHGTDLLCNDRFAVLFGIDPAIVGVLPRAEMRRLALERVKDPAEFSEVIERVYGDPTLEQEDEIEVCIPSPRILRRHTAPVRHASGEIVGRIWSFLDITETRRLQTQVKTHAVQLELRLEEQALELQNAQQILLETAQMRAVATLATGIAHDLRNILTTLRLEAAVNGQSNGYLAGQLDRLYALTHSLLALSEEAATDCGNVNIGDTICFVFQLVRGQAEIDGITLSLNVEDDLPYVIANARRMEHLFINLVLNALNAMAATGGELKAEIGRDAGGIKIKIADSGPGIPSEHLNRLFEPFFTTRSNRTGLGLFSARRIVESHGGEITIANLPGCGAMVTVVLPGAAVELTDAAVARL